MNRVVSSFDVRRLTLLYRIALQGSDLSMEWLAVRLRKALKDLGGSVDQAPIGDRIGFEAPLARLTMTRVNIPMSFSGFVHIRRLPGVVEVAAETSLATPILSFFGGLAGVALLYRRDMIGLGLYWSGVSFIALAAAIHLYQTINALRVVAEAGVAMEHDTA